MSLTFPSIEWTVELIDLAVSSIPAASLLMDSVWPTTWSSWPVSGAAARLMLSAFWLTFSRTFTVSRSWSIGVTWLRMNATRSSMWLAVIRMVTRQATAANAQTTMPTRIRSARPRSSLSLLLMAPTSVARAVDAAGLGADALERAVHVHEAAEDVARVGLGRAQEAVGGVHPVQDVAAAKLVGRVLDVLQGLLDRRRPAEHGGEHVRGVHQTAGDRLQDARRVGHRSGRVDQRVGRVDQRRRRPGQGPRRVLEGPV